MFIPIAGMIIGTAVGIYGTSRGWSFAMCFFVIMSLSLVTGAMTIALQDFGNEIGVQAGE